MHIVKLIIIQLTKTLTFHALRLIFNAARPIIVSLTSSRLTMSLVTRCLVPILAFAEDETLQRPSEQMGQPILRNSRS